MKRNLLRRIVYSAVFLLAAGSSSAEGQDIKSESQLPLSSANVLPTIVYQARSPLRFERFVVLTTASGRAESFYAARNTGDKAIRTYTVALWYIDNTGFVGEGLLPKDNVLRPGDVVSSVPDGSKIADSPKNEPIKKIAFIMVVEIVFDDNTVLSFENEFKALETHLEKLEALYDRQVSSQR